MDSLVTFNFLSLASLESYMFTKALYYIHSQVRSHQGVPHGRPPSYPRPLCEIAGEKQFLGDESFLVGRQISANVHMHHHRVGRRV